MLQVRAFVLYGVHDGVLTRKSNGRWGSLCLIALGVTTAVEVLMTLCPDMGCQHPIPPSVFRKLLTGNSLSKYEESMSNSFVNDNPLVQNCPMAGCTYVVEYTKNKQQDILCACGYGFCWSCKEEAHRPIGCADVGR